MDIAQQIDRGAAIVAEIAMLEEELKGIEEGIRAHAKAHPDLHVPLGDPEREGRQFLAQGDAFTVPVVFTADKIVSSFADQSDKHKEILAAIGVKFSGFFRPVNAWENRFKDGKQFRDKADDLLGADAPAFITACKATDKFGIPKHDVKVEWKQAAAAKKFAELATPGSEVAK